MDEFLCPSILAFLLGQAQAAGQLNGGLCNDRDTFQGPVEAFNASRVLFLW